MRTHPICLRLDGRRCVVLGGDDAAEAKAEACLLAGARVVVIAPDPSPRLEELARAGQIALERRAHLPGDLAGAFVAYASVRDPGEIARIRAEADREHVLLNVVDVPDACTFFSPAVVRRGDLQVAVTTGGTSPALAARLRRDLERDLGPEYEPFVAILGAVRRSLAGTPERAQVLGRLLDSELLSLVRERAHDGVDRLLVAIGGERCSLARLGVGLDGER